MPHGNVPPPLTLPAVDGLAARVSVHVAVDVKAAATLIGWLIDTVHGDVPLQPLAFQPENALCSAGVALRVTRELNGNAKRQVPLALEPDNVHEIPVGLDETVPAPYPALGNAPEPISVVV